MRDALACDVCGALVHREDCATVSHLTVYRFYRNNVGPEWVDIRASDAQEAGAQAARYFEQVRLRDRKHSRAGRFEYCDS